MSEISAVIVTHRNQATIAECLRAVQAALEAAGRSFEIVVIDSASDDRTVDVVRQQWLVDRLLTSDENIGFGRGCNRGVDSSNGRYVLLVNPDTVIESSAVEALLEAAARFPRAAVIGGVTVDAEGQIDPRSVLPTPSLRSALAFCTGVSSAFPGSWLDPDSRVAAGRGGDVPAVSGALMLVPRQAWDHLGGFDADFTVYGEDVDFCVRARATGYRVISTPRARARHEAGASSTTANRAILLKAGQAELMRKHLGPIGRRVGMAALVVGTGWRALASRWGVGLDAERQGRPVSDSSVWPAAWKARRRWRGGWGGRPVEQMLGTHEVAPSAGATPAGPALLMVVQNMPFALDRRVRAEAAALRDAGWTVSVICPRGPSDPPETTIDGVGVHTYRPAPVTTGVVSFVIEFAYAWVQAARLSARVYRRQGFSVIHGCNPPDTYWLLARLWSLVGVRYVYDQHDLNPEVFEAKFGRRGILHRALLVLEACSYRTAVHVLAPNESYRDTAVGRGRVAPQDVSVVMSSPDPAALRPTAPEPALRRGFDHLVCYVGIMGPQDGVDRLLQAIHHYVTTLGRRDAHFGLLGYGDSLAELRSLASELDLDDYVTFTGMVTHEAISRWLSTADVGVTPDPKTRFNDMSTMNKTLEYMAHELAVVATDLVETRRSARDGAVYVDTPEEMGEAIADLLDDPEARLLLGKRGRRRLEEDIAWPRQAERLTAAYARLHEQERGAGKSWSVHRDLRWTHEHT